VNVKSTLTSWVDLIWFLFKYFRRSMEENKKETPKQHALIGFDGKWRDEKAVKDAEILVKKMRMYGGGKGKD
jgi:hypothetical protein